MINKKIYNLLFERNPIAVVKKIRRDGKFFLVLSDPINKITAINEIAAFIIKKCNGKKTIKDIVLEIHSLYPDIDISQQTNDVIRYIKDLENLGIVNEYVF